MTKQVKLDVKEVAMLAMQQLIEQGEFWDNTKITAEWKFIYECGDLFDGLRLIVSQEEEQKG